MDQIFIKMKLMHVQCVMSNGTGPDEILCGEK